MLINVTDYVKLCNNFCDFLKFFIKNADIDIKRDKNKEKR